MVNKGYKKTPKKQKSEEFLPKKSFITAYRAHMLVITNLAILAVDFHAFPRRFAKVETWGTSLMDLGVGSFVFSMGLANSRAVINRKLVLGQKGVSYGKLLVGNTIKALPVLGLGVARLVSVKTLEYQEHASEYGIHWNFYDLGPFARCVGYLGSHLELGSSVHRSIGYRLPLRVDLE